MKITVDQFESYESVYLTGQMPEADMQALLADNPHFAFWYGKRAAARKAASSPTGQPPQSN